MNRTAYKTFIFVTNLSSPFRIILNKVVFWCRSASLKDISNKDIDSFTVGVDSSYKIPCSSTKEPCLQKHRETYKNPHIMLMATEDGKNTCAGFMDQRADVKQSTKRQSFSGNDTRKVMNPSKTTVLPKPLLEKVTRTIQAQSSSETNSSLQISDLSHTDSKSITFDNEISSKDKNLAKPDGNVESCQGGHDEYQHSTCVKQHEFKDSFDSTTCEESGVNFCDQLFDDSEAQIEKKRKKRLQKRTVVNDDVIYVDSLFDGEFDRNYRKSQRNQKKKKKNADKNLNKESEKNVDESTSTQNKRKVRIRPNYFIAIQINNPQIHKIAKEIQETILDKNKDLSPAMISLPKLHLTMSVLHLDNQDNIDRASAALDMFCQKYHTEFYNKPLLLDVTGLGNFRNSVLFAKVAPGENTDHLQKIADGVEDCLEDCGILPTEKGFKPHITLAKLSKDFIKLRSKGIKAIDSSLYQDYIDCYFGRQTVSSLQLCSMTKKKDPSGYYHVAHKVSIGSGADKQTCHHEERFQDMKAEDTKIDAACVLNKNEIDQQESLLTCDTDHTAEVTQDIMSGNGLMNNDSDTQDVTSDNKPSSDSDRILNNQVVIDSNSVSVIQHVDDSATPVTLSDSQQVDDSATPVTLSDIQQVDDSTTPVTLSDIKQVDDSATPVTLSDSHQVDDSATPVTLCDSQQVDDSATPVTLCDSQQVDDSATPVTLSDIKQVGDSATPVTLSDPQSNSEYSDIIKYSFDSAIETLKYLSQEEKESSVNDIQDNIQDTAAAITDEKNNKRDTDDSSANCSGDVLDSVNIQRDTRDSAGIESNVATGDESEFDRNYRKSQRNQKKKKKNADKNLSKESEKNVNESTSTQNKRKVRIRPNYFIAIQINNPQIHKIAKEIQETILDKNKDLSPAMISLPKLHLTMSVLHLDNQDNIDRASAALDMFCQKYHTEFYNKPLLLDVTGLGNFRNSVLFAKVAPGENTDHLQKIADGIEDCLEDCGILPTEKGFNPHITLAKLSKDFIKLRSKGIKAIDSSLYQDYIDCYFGRQTVSSLQLCSMIEKKDPSGYYHVAHKVSIGSGADKQTCHHEERFQDMKAEDTKIDAACVLNKNEIDQQESLLTCDTDHTAEVTQDIMSGNGLMNNDSDTQDVTSDNKPSSDSDRILNNQVVIDSNSVSVIQHVDDSATPVTLSDSQQVDDSATPVTLSDIQQVDDSTTPVTLSDIKQVDDSATPVTLSDSHQVDDSATPVTLCDSQQVDDSATPVTLCDSQQVDDSATPVTLSDIKQVGDSATPVTLSDPQSNSEYSDIIKYSFDSAIETLKYLSQEEKESSVNDIQDNIQDTAAAITDEKNNKRDTDDSSANCSGDVLDSVNIQRDTRDSAGIESNVATGDESEFDRNYRKSQRNQKKKKKNADKNLSKESEKNVNESTSTQNKRKVRIRPNYFIAIQINNPQIHKIAKEIQETILDKNKDLSPAMISLPKLHLTMSVLHLDNQDNIDRASAALDMFCQKYHTEFYNKPLLLDVTGLGNFRNSVLFAKVAPGENTDHLQKIADGIEDCLEDCGILPTEKGFNPHITLAKLSKDFIKLRSKGIKAIDSSLYQDYIDCYFGRQTVSSLQLCSMIEKKDPSGYYHVAHKVSIGSGSDKQTCHHEERFQDMKAEDTKIDAACVLNKNEIDQQESLLTCDTDHTAEVTQDIMSGNGLMNNDSDTQDVTSDNKPSSDSDRILNNQVVIDSNSVSVIQHVDDSATPVTLSDSQQVDDSATPVTLSDSQQVDDSATPVTLSDSQWWCNLL